MEATVDTIKNLIWGEEKKEEEKHEEPANGKLGNTKAGEPYDAGNLDSTLIDSAVMESTTKSAIGSSKIDSNTTSTSATANPEAIIAETKIDPLFPASVDLPLRPAADDLTAKPEEVSHPSLAAGESLVAGGEQEQPLPEGHRSYPVQASSTEEVSHPSLAAGVPLVAGGDIKHPLPEGHKTYPIQSSEFPETTSKTSPLDANQGASVPAQAPTCCTAKSSEPGYLEKKAAEEKPNSAGEKIGAGGQLHKESVGDASGDQHVESSGTKASGGDFNASAPGAGKEADRLRGSISTDHSLADDESGDGIGGDGKHKKSLKEKLHDGKEKIKEKLHKN